MKKMQFKTLLFCCLAALLFASCNTDDDSELTPEQRQTAFQMVKGPHEGFLLYSATNPDNPKDQVDSIPARWTIQTDSTMTIFSFPTSVIAESITDEALKNAMKAADPHDLQCKIWFFNLDPVAFYVNPITLSYQLTYGGAEHQVQIVFFINNYVSQGNYQSSTRNVSMQIVVATLYIDGKEAKVLKNIIPFVFTTDKK